ncbi:MAG: hypothetical protein OEZ58_01960 [Gammaproteobacteria bacterium]|nr:hypothetical protein [Gammaproteobacteria bacterium]
MDFSGNGVTAKSLWNDKRFYFRPATSGPYAFLVSGLNDLMHNYSVSLTDESVNANIDLAAIINSLSIDKTSLVHGADKAVVIVNAVNLGALGPSNDFSNVSSRFEYSPLVYSSHLEMPNAADNQDELITIYPKGDATMSSTYTLGFNGKTAASTSFHDVHIRAGGAGK